jgi:hypothetical protein
MPLLEVIQTKHISASIRLSDMTAIQVDQYAAFIRACADDVVEQALAYVFFKGPRLSGVSEDPRGAKGCFHASHPKSTYSRSGRVSGKEARFSCPIGVYSHTSSGRIEGMILLTNPWRDHNGASHRKNIDTPPLLGCCVGTKGPYSEPAQTSRLIQFAVPYKEPV